MTATELTVLRVFIGPDGRGGNPLGVFLEGAAIPPDRRQAVAVDLNFSETVFVDDREQGRVRIFTPGRELPFAGHPSVGTSWLLHETGTPIDVLRPPAGDVRVRRDPERTWVTADPAWVAHAFRFAELRRRLTSRRIRSRRWAIRASTSGAGSTSRPASSDRAASRRTSGSPRTRPRAGGGHAGRPTEAAAHDPPGRRLGDPGPAPARRHGRDRRPRRARRAPPVRGRSVDLDRDRHQREVRRDCGSARSLRAVNGTRADERIGDARASRPTGSRGSPAIGPLVVVVRAAGR